MLICKDCFTDEEIRSEVVNNASTKGICSVCGANEMLCELDYFMDFFSAVLHLYEKSDNDGLPIVDTIQKDWKIFSDSKFGHTILSEVIDCDNSILFGIDDTVRYADTIRERVDTWNRLKKQVREETRFFSDIEDFKTYNVLEPTETLKQGSTLFRARVIPENCEKLTPKDMGCPSKEKATAGRANPVGIPYLYLCEDIDTTYYEVRAVYLDRLAVGRFVIQRQLSIVNFHFDISLYLIYSDGETSLEEMVARKKIVDAISLDLSRPLRRYDSEIEYVPTQLICEYCKRMTNADGISFESSLRKGHTNYVLFDQRDAKCTKVYEHEVAKISISRG